MSLIEFFICLCSEDRKLSTESMRTKNTLIRLELQKMAVSHDFRGGPSFAKTIKTVGFPMDQHYYLDQKKPWGGRFLWGMVGQVGQADGVDGLDRNVGRLELLGRMGLMTDDRRRRTEDRRQIEKNLETASTGWKIRRGAQGKNRDNEKMEVI